MADGLDNLQGPTIADSTLPQPAPILRLPKELFLIIAGSLSSVRDWVNLDVAVTDGLYSPVWAIEWKALGLAHSVNLLADPALCKHIKYDENDKQEWAKKTMKPAPSTGLKPDESYAQMLRSVQPQTDMNGNAVTKHQIEDYLAQEQVGWRRKLVFMPRTQREDRDYPEDVSRIKIGMLDADARNYAQLLEQASSIREKNLIEHCRIEDNKPRAIRVRQEEAFRTFFHMLVRDESFQPVVCVSCLDPDCFVWTFTTRSGSAESKVDVRFCEHCMVEYAGLRDLKLIGIDDLLTLEVSVPSQLIVEETWFALLHTSSSQVYLSRTDANKICQLSHGLDHDQLLSANLPKAVLVANRQRYLCAAQIAGQVVKLHYSKNGVWSMLDIDVKSYEFWSNAVSWAKTVMPPANLEDHKRNRDLATLYWEVNILVPGFHRRTKTRSRTDHHVVEVREIARLEFPDAHVLDDYTLPISRLDVLCQRIHGKTSTQASMDPTATSVSRLSMHFLNTAGLLTIFKRFDAGQFEALVDLTAIVQSMQTDRLPSTREQSVSCFLDFYYDMMPRVSHSDARFASVSDVPSDAAFVAANAFFNLLEHTPFLHTATTWAIGKAIAVRLPDMCMHGLPDFVRRFITNTSTIIAQDGQSSFAYHEHVGRFSFVPQCPHRPGVVG